MLAKSKYKNQFYLRHRAITSYSSKKIVELFPNFFKPESILDIGCGTGEWIKAFKDRYSSCEFSGIDGYWVKKDDLIYKEINFFNIDLKHQLSSEVFNKKYDLVCCLETITDLPENRGRIIIKEITKITKLCLFSSGTPVQNHGPHINIQWQSYWHNLFAQNGFIALDFIRPKTWDDPNVGPWYSQNCFLFVEKSWLKDNPRWQNLVSNIKIPIDIVHPKLLPISIKDISLKLLIKSIPIIFINFFKRLILKIKKKII